MYCKTAPVWGCIRICDQQLPVPGCYHMCLGPCTTTLACTHSDAYAVQCSNYLLNILYPWCIYIYIFVHTNHNLLTYVVRTSIGWIQCVSPQHVCVLYCKPPEGKCTKQAVCHWVCGAWQKSTCWRYALEVESTAPSILLCLCLYLCIASQYLLVHTHCRQPFKQWWLHAYIVV